MKARIERAGASTLIEWPGGLSATVTAQPNHCQVQVLVHSGASGPARWRQHHRGAALDPTQLRPPEESWWVRKPTHGWSPTSTPNEAWWPGKRNERSWELSAAPGLPVPRLHTPEVKYHFFTQENGGQLWYSPRIVTVEAPLSQQTMRQGLAELGPARCRALGIDPQEARLRAGRWTWPELDQERRRAAHVAAPALVKLSDAEHLSPGALEAEAQEVERYTGDSALKRRTAQDTEDLANEVLRRLQEAHTRLAGTTLKTVGLKVALHLSASAASWMTLEHPPESAPHGLSHAQRLLWTPWSHHD